LPLRAGLLLLPADAAWGHRRAVQRARPAAGGLMLVIGNGVVVSDGRERRADVAVEDGTIVDVAPHIDAAGATFVDAAGCYVAPGFIDLQLNGAFGVDFTSASAGSATSERLAGVWSRLRGYGVTSCLPTVVSAS